MRNTARNEQIQAESAAIRRYAAVAAIKRQALGLVIPGRGKKDREAPHSFIRLLERIQIDSNPHRSRTQPALDSSDAARWLLANGESVLPTVKAALGEIGRARPLFIIPENRLRRVLMSCVCVSRRT
jgi:hypothetical protein